MAEGRAALLTGVLAVVWLAACERERSEASPLPAQPEAFAAAGDPMASSATDVAAVAPEGSGLCPAHVQAAQWRGMSFAHSWGRGSGGYGSETARASLQELAGLGIDWVSLIPFGYEEDLDSTEVVRPTRGGGESDDRVLRTIASAHALGLRVMLKPHLWVRHGEWQGLVRPAGPDGWGRWFSSYEEFIRHYAELAEGGGADMLVVGVELPSATQADPDRWRHIIAGVREIYHGPLVYAANWDEAEGIPFWDALDYIGVQMYAPMADGPDDPPEALRRHAEAWLARYQALSGRVGRPILLTEVGYTSLRGSAVTPNVWPEEVGGAAQVDQGVQAAAYCALLQTFGQAEEVAGIFWWKWFTDPTTDEEGPIGFSPRGKLAEEILRQAYRR